MENGDSIMKRMDNPDTPENSATVSAFYSMLHNAHKTTKTSECDIILPKCLKPNLRPYQIRALDWMTNRERQRQFYPNEFAEVQIKNVSLRQKTFFFNLTTYQLFDELPNPIEAPTGGILGIFLMDNISKQMVVICLLLADEMGLGKTIEILALVLYNKQNKRKLEDVEEKPFSGKFAFYLFLITKMS